MSEIAEIEKIIRQIIRVNESLVTNYDSEMLCSDWEGTKNILKELADEKKGLIKNLEKSFNNFFHIELNPITEKIKIYSFSLIPNPLNYKLLFNVPKSVDRYSKEYFCYISLMEKLEREYDVIELEKNNYCLLDISATLNIEKLFAKK